MNKLYFTTRDFHSPIYGLMASRMDLPEFKDAVVKGRNWAYIHGEAEDLAGYDIPDYIGGDKAQLDRDIDDQEIAMVLGDIEYPCVAIFKLEHGSDPGSYYLILVSEYVKNLK